MPLLVVGSSLYYPRTFSRNLRQSCSLVCLDLPHFVQLDNKFKYGSINFDSYAEHIEAVRAAEGLEQVVVVGHSHHGNVALEYAKRYPQRVSGVVMIGSPPANIAQTIEAAETYWASHASEERKLILQNRRRSIDERPVASLSPTDTYISHYVADAPLYWNDPDYGTYRLPLAVAATLWEGVLPKLRNVTFHLLKHSGHTPQLEQPDEFDRILLRWIQKEGGDHVS